MLSAICGVAHTAQRWPGFESRYRYLRKQLKNVFVCVCSILAQRKRAWLILEQGTRRPFDRNEQMLVGLIVKWLRRGILIEQ